MNSTKQLSVIYDDRLVGKMALWQDRIAAFEYSDEWLADGFSVSPFSLPLEKRFLCLDEIAGECERLLKTEDPDVFAHNRDDHSKNFIFLYSEREDRRRTRYHGERKRRRSRHRRYTGGGEKHGYQYR